MRIISGEFKNREIKTPKSLATHPMGSREKIALFNMISGYLPEAEVLDAFAGSGALGLEALSRGAKEVIFVENSHQSAKIIRENIMVLGVEERTNLIEQNVVNFTTDRQFDVIFADPPYDKFDIDKINLLPKMLKSTGILVLSHPKLDEIPEITGLELIKSHSYAAATISLYQKR